MADNKSILIISDMVGIGTIATTAMMPILTYLGFSTCSLPTSLVSNNFGYGSYAMTDTSDYLRETFPVMEKLGFGFMAIATGFIPSLEQAVMISDFCRKQAKGGTPIFVDPVMGDGGEMYKGLPATTVDSMKKMLEVADLCYPNYPEACYLTGAPYKSEGIGKEDAFKMVDEIRAMGSASVLITSIKVDGKASVAGFNAEDGEYFILGYEEIPLVFSGTGDVFSAILIGNLLKGMGLKRSTRKAMDGVYNLIMLNKDAKDPYLGLPVEKYLTIL